MSIDNKLLLDLYSSSENNTLFINIDKDTVLKLSAEKLTLDEYNKLIGEDVNSNTTEVNSNTTIVTGLWDIGRNSLSETFARSYDHYKEKFAELLQSPVNMYIYVSKEDEEFIWKHRSPNNTVVKIMELDEFDTWFDFFDKVQDIRTSPNWTDRTDWVATSPQAKLKYYNPIVLSKLFLLNNVTLFNPFNTENFFWIDAGITNTVHSGYFTHDKVFDNLEAYVKHVNKVIFLSYPYTSNTEIHGFARSDLKNYVKSSDINYVCRGGFFGGNKVDINRLNGMYYDILNKTLSSSHMGTEETIFTILSYNNPKLIHRYNIGEDGLIYPFFEDLKDVNVLIENTPRHIRERGISELKTNLYILGYNSPKQFHMVCSSIQTADSKLFDKCQKFLINNSTNEDLFDEYDKYCKQYGFTEIHLDNVGICGGRQFIAEHFEETDADFYLFFEDDMLLNTNEYLNAFCDSGMVRYIGELYDKLIGVMVKEKFDFLKLSFTEFYGNNSVQWAWYNVPQSVRTEIWPDYDILPEYGLDPNSPKTQFNSISYLGNMSYISGEIYYSNWPQIVSREGNRKMFLNTKWQSPYEQTWMSYMFQETRKGNLKPGVLLASLITHERFDHYKPEERREN